ncbi:MAG: beta strand repeat-containing protein [Caulobacteraceae bacterium]
MAQIDWTGAVNGYFDNASYWSGGAVPGASDDAILNAPGAAFTVTSNANETVHGVQTAANATLDVTAGVFTAYAGTDGGVNAGTIEVGEVGGPSASFTFGGTLDNTGTVAIYNKPGSYVPVLTIGAAGAALSGGGQVELTGSTIVTGAAAGVTLTNIDNTITAQGFFGDHKLALVNEAAGVIDGAGGRLYINTGTSLITNAGLIESSGSNTQIQSSVANTGTLEAAGGGRLFLYGQGAGETIDDSAGGVILAADGSTVFLAQATIVGGYLRTAGTGVIEAAGHVDTLDGTTSAVTNEGTVVIQNNNSLALEGTIANTGAIELDGRYFYSLPAATLAIGAGGATLSGGGQILLTNAGNDVITGAGGGAMLVNIDNTISGAGKIGLGDGNLTLVNGAGGVIDSNLSNSRGLTINTGSNVVTNAGLIEANGVGLVLHGTVAGAGTIAAIGANVALQSADIIGGALTSSGAGKIVAVGNGRLDGSASAVSNAGQFYVEPGATLTVQGSIANSGTIDVGGPSAVAVLAIDPAGVTLSGGGLVAVGPSSAIEGAGGTAATLVNAGDTITGTGTIFATNLVIDNLKGGAIGSHGAGALTLESVYQIVNNGVLAGTGAGGLSIENTYVDQSGGGVTYAGDGSKVVLGGGAIENGTLLTAGSGVIVNEGTLEAGSRRGGGHLSIHNALIDQRLGGEILAEERSTVVLSGADIIGGTLATSRDGKIVTGLGLNILDGTSGEVLNTATVTVSGGTELGLEGAIDNVGRIAVGGSIKGASLSANVDVTLSGGGTIAASKLATNSLFGAATTAVTVTNIDNHIATAGTLGNANLTLINQSGGVIQSHKAASLTIDTGSNILVNAGTIKAVSFLAIQSAVDNTGHLVVEGGDMRIAAAVTGSGTATIDGGTLQFMAGFDENVTFTHRNPHQTGVLELARPVSYTGTVIGFEDELILDGIHGGTASFSGSATRGVLTVSDGATTASIHLKGDYVGVQFAVGQDSSGDAVVTIAPAGHGGHAATPPPHAFVAAMASFVPTAAGPVHLHPPTERLAPLALAGPRAAMA